MINSLLQILQNENKMTVKLAEAYFKDEIIKLQMGGYLALECDESLGGLSLELRVFQLFSDKGFDIDWGRPDKEDFLVRPNASMSGHPLVIEVKSSKSPRPKLDNLRQLDDWVFSLSGEEQARKDGLGGGVDSVAIALDGYMTSKQYHPSPHKGVLVFNGSLGISFDQRSRPLLDGNTKDFAEMRNFCVISLDDLIELLRSDEVSAWNAIHETVGEFHR
jgi:hypothetical protein